MTRSSRGMDRIVGRPKWTSTKYKCEECKGVMRKLSANHFVWIIYDLEQQIRNQ